MRIQYRLLTVLVTLLQFGGPCTAVGPFKNLVTFGDSYTDKVNVGDGGIAWPVYVGTYSNNTVAVYDFARSGGTCSNKIAPRPYPSVMESQLPQYGKNVTTKSNGSISSTYIIGSNGAYVPLASNDTLYSIWIGTNDVGAAALLTDPLKDVSIVNTTACVFDWVKFLYDQGARNFLIQNMIPLQLIPMYSATGYTTKFFNYPHNQTEWSLMMAELVRSGNELQALRTKYIAPSQFPGARFGLFDSYGLFKNMYENPASYLVGPNYNVTGVVNTCKYPYGNSSLVCVTQPAAVWDSYLWYDELHPSVAANRVVAREILKTINGAGTYVTWHGAK
ncbi:carbohydrate esterase family 16 protein [Ceratobasidium sp. AG-Ba]|nr:carbohydrate esterase family 16 protein [Ceratobasidium sp. AG-Ba]